MLQYKDLSAMVKFSILLVEETLAFKYAIVRLFGERNMIELNLLCQTTTAIYNARARKWSH